MPKVGRPTKYTPEIIEEISTYLREYETGEINNLPTRYKFAQRIGVNDDTLVEWENKTDKEGNLVYPDFSAAIKRIDKAQKQQLMDHGMYGGKEVNSTMAIFLLKANHGLIETNRQELTGKDGEKLVIIKDGSKTKSVAE